MSQFRKKTFEMQRNLFNHSICLKVGFLDRGMHVLLTGGTQTHIGAVSVVNEMGHVQTISLPGHKEYLITEHWSQQLYLASKEPVVLTAGIHYDQLSRQEIEIVMQTVDDMFKKSLKILLQIDE